MMRLKLVLSLIGLALAVVGVATNNLILVDAAIVVLAASIVLRLLLRRRERTEGSR